MGGLVIYSLKVAILTTAFYLCWRMLLSKETLHRLNRFVLVLIPPVSMILPFCVITFHKTVIVPATETAAQAGAAMEASAQLPVGGVVGQHPQSRADLRPASKGGSRGSDRRGG